MTIFLTYNLICTNSLLSLSLPISFSIFGLNKHNRLIDNMASDNIEQLTVAIQSNAALRGKLTTLNITRNVMNLACSQGPSSCLQHNTFQFDNCSPPVEFLFSSVTIALHGSLHHSTACSNWTDDVTD